LGYSVRIVSIQPDFLFSINYRFTRNYV
jgi:hypothetical protein